MTKFPDDTLYWIEENVYAVMKILKLAMYSNEFHLIEPLNSIEFNHPGQLLCIATDNNPF